MAKPVICDRCGKILPENDIVRDFTRLFPSDEFYGLEVRFFNTSDGVKADICRQCGAELVLKTAADIQSKVSEAKKKGHVVKI